MLKRDPVTGWSEARAAAAYTRSQRATLRAMDRVHAAKQRLADAQRSFTVARRVQSANAAIFARARKAREA